MPNPYEIHNIIGAKHTNLYNLIIYSGNRTSWKCQQNVFYKTQESNLFFRRCYKARTEAKVASDSPLLSTDRQVISGDDSPLTYCCDDWSSPGV